MDLTWTFFLFKTLKMADISQMTNEHSLTPSLRSFVLSGGSRAGSAFRVVTPRGLRDGE